MKLQIITPVKLVKEVEAVSVTLPTASGEITILAKHQPILTLLVEGIVTYKTTQKEDFLTIGGGYAQTDGNITRILVSSAYGQEQIDDKLTQEAIVNAQKILKESKDSGERTTAVAVLRRSIIDSKLIKKHKHSQNL